MHVAPAVAAQVAAQVAVQVAVQERRDQGEIRRQCAAGGTHRH